MNRCFRLLVLGSAVAMIPVPNTQAQGNEAGAYTVSYIEVTQAAEGRAVALLKELGAASRAGARPPGGAARQSPPGRSAQGTSTESSVGESRATT